MSILTPADKDCLIAQLRQRIAELELELQRYKQAPNLPHISDGSCNTTHYACDCVLKRITELEEQLKNTKEHANAAASWLRRGWISKAAKEIEKIGGDV